MERGPQINCQMTVWQGWGIFKMVRMFEAGLLSSFSRGRHGHRSGDPFWQCVAVSCLAKPSHLAQTPEG